MNKDMGVSEKLGVYPINNRHFNGLHGENDHWPVDLGLPYTIQYIIIIIVIIIIYYYYYLLLLYIIIIIIIIYYYYY